MRVSQSHFITLREVPTDAEVVSHRYLLRAGMIRKVASGVYAWLPFGLQVLNNVSQIVREEMNASGALECLLPCVQPSELWQESERWEMYGRELLRFKDRHERDFCFGPTHEEVITDLVRDEIRSYKQLPRTFYQIQTKFRDEIRPRFGLMRAREFMMKDAYSFDLDKEGLDKSYRAMFDAYVRIFDRLGLDYRPVLADTGSIGGDSSHEFQVLADTGEDVIAYSDSSDYAANIELAEALTVLPANADESPKAREKVATPGQKTIKSLCEFLSTPVDETVKTLVVHGEEGLVAIILRGDHTLNPLKVEKHPLVKAPLTMASDEDITKAFNASPGSLGPVDCPIPYIVDKSAAKVVNFSCGANETDFHYINVNWGRDCEVENEFDCRLVIEGDASPDGQGQLRLTRGIEVGHVFKLGDKYSQAMGLNVLNADGKAVVPLMGCYGIGVSRIVAAAIEQNHDDNGIIWPRAIAPFDVHLIPIKYAKSTRVREACDALYEQLQQAGVSVLFDDRNERPGVMFADADLIGMPYQIIVGDRGLDNNEVEVKTRADGETRSVSLDGVLDVLGD